MTTSLNNAIVREDNGIIVVCAYCVPRPRLEAINREYPGQVSHGMCPKCFVRQHQELEAFEAARRRQQVAA
jgi:hypothetical protein